MSIWYLCTKQLWLEIYGHCFPLALREEWALYNLSKPEVCSCRDIKLFEYRCTNTRTWVEEKKRKTFLSHGTLRCSRPMVATKSLNKHWFWPESRREANLFCSLVLKLPLCKQNSSAPREIHIFSCLPWNKIKWYEAGGENSRFWYNVGLHSHVSICRVQSCFSFIGFYSWKVRRLSSLEENRRGNENHTWIHSYYPHNLHSRWLFLCFLLPLKF